MTQNGGKAWSGEKQNHSQEAGRGWWTTAQEAISPKVFFLHRSLRGTRHPSWGLCQPFVQMPVVSGVHSRNHGGACWPYAPLCAVFILALKSWLTPLERHSIPCKQVAGYQGSSSVCLERWRGFSIALTSSSRCHGFWKGEAATVTDPLTYGVRAQASVTTIIL